MLQRPIFCVLGFRHTGGRSTQTFTCWCAGHGACAPLNCQSLSASNSAWVALLKLASLAITAKRIIFLLPSFKYQNMHKKILLTSLLAIAAGCGAKEKTAPTPVPESQPIPAITKSSDGKKYQNELFRLSVEKPESWYSQNVEEMISLQKFGNNMVSGKDKNLKAAIDASLENNIPLFSFFEFAPGTPGKLIPSLIANAENISLYPGIKNGCDYLYHTKELLGRSQANIKFGENCNQAQISGQKFGYYDAIIEIKNIKVYQKYYSCRKGKHALNFIGTYFEKSSEEKIEQILKTIKVECDK